MTRMDYVSQVEESEDCRIWHSKLYLRDLTTVPPMSPIPGDSVDFTEAADAPTSSSDSLCRLHEPRREPPPTRCRPLRHQNAIVRGVHDIKDGGSAAVPRHVLSALSAAKARESNKVALKLEMEAESNGAPMTGNPDVRIDSYYCKKLARIHTSPREPRKTEIGRFRRLLRLDRSLLPIEKKLGTGIVMVMPLLETRKYVFTKSLPSAETAVFWKVMENMLRANSHVGDVVKDLSTDASAFLVDRYSQEDITAERYGRRSKPPCCHTASSCQPRHQMMTPQTSLTWAKCSSLASPHTICLSQILLPIWR